MVIFRENTEDIYAGIEYAAGTPEAQKVLDFLAKEFPKEFKKIRFGTARRRGVAGAARSDRRAEARVGVEVGIGLKPISYLGTERLVHSAIELRDRQQAQERDAGAQGQHHEVHRGRVPRLGLPGREGVLRRGRDRRRPVVPDSGREAGRRHRHQGRDRRHHAAAGADAARRVRRHRDAESQRRLSVRRARGAGRRHRHRAGRQHQLRHRPRHLRGDARHGAEVRRPGQGQPGLGDPVGRDDAPAPGLERGGRPRSSRAWTARSPRSASPTTSRG